MNVRDDPLVTLLFQYGSLGAKRVNIGPFELAFCFRFTCDDGDISLNSFVLSHDRLTCGLGKRDVARKMVTSVL